MEALLRDEIHRISVKILADEDLSALTMDRIAKGVGVSRGTLYNHFADRDALIDYLADRQFGPILDEIERIAELDTAPAERLTTIAETVFDSIYRDPCLVIALVPEKFCKANRESELERQRRALGAAAKIIREGIAAGAFRQVSVELVCEYFFHAIAGKIEDMALEGRFDPAGALAPPLMDVFLGGLRQTC